MNDALALIGVFLNLVGTLLLTVNAFSNKGQIIRNGISKVTVVKPKHQNPSIIKTLENASADDPQTQQNIIDLYFAKAGLIILALGFFLQFFSILFVKT